MSAMAKQKRNVPRTHASLLDTHARLISLVEDAVLVEELNFTLCVLVKHIEEG